MNWGTWQIVLLLMVLFAISLTNSCQNSRLDDLDRRITTLETARIEAIAEPEMSP